MAKQLNIFSYFGRKTVNIINDDTPRSDVNSEPYDRNGKEAVGDHKKDFAMTSEKLKNWPRDDAFKFWDTRNGKVCVI